jgi:hypothetical protein
VFSGIKTNSSRNILLVYAPWLVEVKKRFFIILFLFPSFHSVWVSARTKQRPLSVSLLLFCLPSAMAAN